MIRLDALLSGTMNIIVDKDNNTYHPSDCLHPSAKVGISGALQEGAGILVWPEFMRSEILVIIRNIAIVLCQEVAGKQ